MTHWTRDSHYWVRFKRIDGKQYKIYQHREIWEQAYGPIPKGMVIDHINHDGFDNRLENLRLVEHWLNGQNRKGLNKNNTSGYRGIYWHKQKQKWHVQIMIKNKKRSLGLYDTIEEAVKTYKREAVYA